MQTSNTSFSSTSSLLTGALIAGGLALLASPRTGAQFREQLMNFAGKAGDGMGRQLGTAMERGIQYAERGQEVLRQASAAVDLAIERGKEYLESGKGLAGTMGRDRYYAGNGSGLAATGALLAGMLIGGGLALLLTPQTGTQFRRQIRTYAGKVKSFGDKAERDIAMVREK